MKLGRVIFPLIFAVLTSSAFAEFISIDSSPSVFFDRGQVTANIKLLNLGDESAYDVSMDVSCADLEASSEIVPELQPDDSIELRALLGTAPEPGGIYTVVYTISYKDSAGKTYSALNAIRLVTDLDAPPTHPVTVTIESTTLERRTRLSPTILADRDMPGVSISIFLPRELAGTPECETSDLEKDRPLSLSFDVRNRSANPGSTYLALIVTDYEDQGGHVSKVTPFNIKVSSAVTPAQSPGLFVLLGFLVVAGIALQFPAIKGKLPISPRLGALLGILACIASVLAIEIFLIDSLEPKLLLKNTTTVGGDTPAHNYIASHMSESLLGHGRIVSWAGGWWCGFPMLQYYFCLPYLIIVMLDLLLPFNIAFKLVCVAGILALPPAAWGCGKIMKLPTPIPVLLGIFTIPILFDHSHVMWGVNIYSTMAGMISNSLSFPLMLLFIASAWRDSEDQHFRPLTVILLVSVLASHFFTSIIGMITVSIIPFLRRPRDIMKSMAVLAAEIALAVAIMAWWIVPLLAKIEYTADFGVNWPDIAFFTQLPLFTRWLSPLLLPALAMMILKKIRPLIVLVWMLAASIFLFYFGFRISNVFVNVRLWPFIVCALTFLEAIGLGYLLSLLPSRKTLVPAVAAAILMFSIDAPNHVSSWAKWNFEGLEAKEHYSVFEKLVLPLEGTPGRLANDLCHENNMLGSSRIFELAPHVAGKPVLEGGIVNSAAGAMFSYYIQGETSENCAGFPTNVDPTTFNIDNATRHLRLFNVKHFIARSETTRRAMAEHKDWRFMGREQHWELYELTNHDGSYVFVPPLLPMAVSTRSDIMDWKTAGLEWIYNIASIDQHFIILPDGEIAPENTECIDAAKYLSLMRSRDKALIEAFNSRRLPETNIDVIEHSDYAIEFSTSTPGIPHIIKTTWYPNWRAVSGEPIYMVTPCFMMIIPEGDHVRLVYGRTASDRAGISITSAAALLLLALIVRSILNRKTTLQARNG